VALPVVAWAVPLLATWLVLDSDRLMLESPPPMAPPVARLPVYTLEIVVVLFVPVAVPLPLAAVPLFVARLVA